LKCGVFNYTIKLITELQKVKGIDIECIELKPGIFRFYLLREILKKNPDIVHIQHEIVMFDKLFGLTSFFLYFYPFLLRKKVITTFHTVKSQSNFKNEIASKYHKNPIIISIAKIYLKILFQVTNFFSNEILVLSKSGKDTLEKEYNLMNVTYVPHGIFKPKKADDKKLLEFRKRLGLEPKDKIILLFGYPFENKGYHYVIESLPIILKKHPETKVLISGGIGSADPEQCISYINRLKNLAKKMGVTSRVVFTEFIPDNELPYLILNSDVAVFPFEDRLSASGSVSTVYSYKIPIVVSDVKAFDFLENQLDCIKIKVGSKGEIADAISWLLEDLELRTKLFKTMEERLKRFSIGDAAKKHREIYGKIKIK
jgi:glycosyltransferase involved in cell wall biosynthesis